MNKKVADPMKQAREKFRRMMEKPVPYSNAEEQEKALQELKEKYVKGVVTTSGLIDDTF